jgi:hypothetical protein
MLIIVSPLFTGYTCSMRAHLAALTVLAAFALACSEPPQKELHQAEGALDAARAAGAETFAADEYREARSLLDQAQQAVAQRDYRLALRHAIDARDRAEEAAGAAADRKAEARGQAERALVAAEGAVRDAQRRLDAARAARMRSRDLAPLVSAIADAEAALQKAREAMKREAYLEARGATEGLDARLNEVIRELDARAAARAPRRRR